MEHVQAHPHPGPAGEARSAITGSYGWYAFSLLVLAAAWLFGRAAGHLHAVPWLSLSIWIPVIGGVAVLLTRDDRHAGLARVIAIATAAAGFIVTAPLYTGFDPAAHGMQFQELRPWIAQFSINYHLGVDGLSVAFVLLNSFVTLLVVMAGWEVIRTRVAQYMAAFLIMSGLMNGVFASLDSLLFYVFFEATLVPMYIVIGVWGGPNRVYAALKFFLYTFLGSAFLLVAMAALAFTHQAQTGVLTFNLVALEHTHLSLTSQVLLFLGFTAAFAVKAPIFPFHTWSPDAYREAPTAGVVILAAVMAKMGTYGILRFDLNLFPRAVVDLAPLLLTLGVVGILYGAVVACAQRDMKRLLAYSSLAHIGFIVMGTFALTTQAISGGVLQMVNHGLITAALFILVGWIYQRRQTWQTDELRGLQRPAPILAAAFTVAMMASIGLPGLNGFVGEFLILSGTFLSHRWWAVVATTGVVFAALYLLWAYQQAFHHEPDAATAAAPDLSWGEGAVIVPLIALIVFLGVYPKPVLDRITPSVDELIQQVHLRTGTSPPVIGSPGPHRVSTTAVGTATTTTTGSPSTKTAALGGRP